MLDRGDGVRLAQIAQAGRSPTVVFLPGFRSDMADEKATALAAFCTSRGQAMLRLDLSGQGRSGGRFEDGTIGRWAADALVLLDRVAGPLLLVGSSMGGWIALLLALARPERVVGLVGVAAAPDFTEELMWGAMLPVEQEALLRHGVLMVPNAYGPAFPLTLALIEDGRRHLLLGGPIALRCPVRLLHGQADTEVPWQTALRIAGRLEGDDVRVTLVKDATHRFSRAPDLVVVCSAVGELLDKGGGKPGWAPPGPAGA